MDDLAFGRALATGDEAAFHALVDRESVVILRLCYRILGSVVEAEDAAQETFVLAYRALHHVPGGRTSGGVAGTHRHACLLAPSRNAVAWPRPHETTR